MSLAGKSILVTGGTGFIGSRLVEKLVLEHRASVRVLVRSAVGAARIARFPVDMLSGDITDRAVVQKVVQGCDVVFHCAYDFAGRSDYQKEVGIQGTRNVGEAVLQERVPRMVHVSTFSVHAPMPNGDLTESFPWPRCKNAYVLIKRQAERLVLKLHRQHSLPVVVVQPTLVYGPFSPHWTVTPLHNLQTGLIPLVNGGAGYCNLVYIDDVVDAMILAATQPDVVGRTFLISGEEPVTWKAFYGAFEATLGIRATVEVSEEKLREAISQRRRRASTVSQLRGLVRHPEVLAQLVGLPIVRGLLKVLRDHLSDGHWESLKTRILPDSSWDQGRNAQPSRPIHIPDEMLLALYRSQTRVCIEQAKKRLGYKPQFDFERGMDLTLRFIHWANLV